MRPEDDFVVPIKRRQRTLSDGWATLRVLSQPKRQGGNEWEAMSEGTAAKRLLREYGARFDVVVDSLLNRAGVYFGTNWRTRYTAQRMAGKSLGKAIVHEFACCAFG